MFSGEIFLLKPLDEISAITHVGDPILLTVVAEEVKVMRNEPPAMATTVQLALFLPERSNSPPYFENDQWVFVAWVVPKWQSWYRFTSFRIHSYVARIDENALQGTALVFSDPYVPRVSDDDTGKNGVFSLTLLGNNGTFEISPNVAERRANFLIYVRDNHLLDYEERHSVQFQVSWRRFFPRFSGLFCEFFVWQILAQELGPATNLSATVNVVVYINDVNDNPPVFAQEMYIAEIPENITAGQRVIQVIFAFRSADKNCKLIDNLSTGACNWRWHRTWWTRSIHGHSRLFKYVAEFESREWVDNDFDKQSRLRSRTDARVSFVCRGERQRRHGQ